MRPRDLRQLGERLKGCASKYKWASGAYAQTSSGGVGYCAMGALMAENGAKPKLADHCAICDGPHVDALLDAGGREIETETRALEVAGYPGAKVKVNGRERGLHAFITSKNDKVGMRFEELGNYFIEHAGELATEPEAEEKLPEIPA